MIYENFNGVSIMAHMVVEGPLTRGFISAIFHYAYRVCGVIKVILPVARSNTRSVDLVEHMGFTPEAVLRDCHPDGELILYTLRNTDCRFLTGRFSLDGQESPRTAAGA